MMKLTTSCVLVLSLTAFGCSKKKEENAAQKSDPAMTPKTTEQPKQEPPPVTPLTGTALADKYKACVEMINAGKIDDFRKDCVDDNYTLHAFGGMPERKGGDTLATYFKDQRGAFSDWKLTPQLIMVSGRNVLAVNLVTGTHSGTLKSAMGEVPATNKKIGMMMFHRLQINDANKATDEWVVADGATMMGQLGLAPKGTPPTRPAMDKGIEGAPIVVVTADDAKEKANMEVVKKGNDAFIANKPADIVATFTPDVVESDQMAAKDAKGTKEVQAGMAMFRGGWSDVKFNDLQMWAGGDWVVQSWKFEGKNDKDMGKMKKTGKTVAVDAVEVLHLKDGKVDRLYRFVNSMDMAMQLGLIPAPGTAPGTPEKGAGATMKEGAKEMGKDVKEGAKDAAAATKKAAGDAKDATKKAAGEVKEEVK